LAGLAVFLAYRRASRSWLAILIRWLLLALLVLAVAEPVLGEGGSRQTIVILEDQSASLNESGQAQALRVVEQLLTIYPAAILNAFCATTRPLATPGDSEIAEDSECEATNIESALNLAGQIIGAGQGRVILISDGQETHGSAEEAARRLAVRDVPVDVWYISSQLSMEDVRLDLLTVPPILYEGQAFDAEVEITASFGTSATLRLSEKDIVIAEREVRLAEGLNTFRFQQTAREAGLIGLTLEVSAASDGVPQNNTASVVAQVYPAPRILIVSNQPNEVFHSVLQTVGIEFDVLSTAELPTRMSDLANYQVILLEDVGANDFSLEQMALIESFVHDEGRGLITTGGSHSYILAGDKGTLLETVRPLEMKPPPKPEQGQVTLLLIIGDSDSMADLSGSMFDSPEKIALARQAAVLASQALEAEDYLGILVFSDTPEWIINFKQVGSGAYLAAIHTQIAQITTMKGTNIKAALDEGLPALVATTTGARYAILLTDGRDIEHEIGDYEQVIHEARQQKVTLSTIAFGKDADVELLTQFAEWGHGRFYSVETAETLPVLMAEEAARISEAPVTEGAFPPEVGDIHPILVGLLLDSMPMLSGYHALEPKSSAEVILQTGDGDPILAVWQYGLGRCVAWTSDLGEVWANDWLTWEDFGRLWAQTIIYTLPDPSLGQLRLSTAVNGQTVAITAESLDDAGRPISLAPTTVTIIAPDGVSSEIPLLEAFPGRYQQSVKVSMSGPYHVMVVQMAEQQARRAEAGFVIDYSREFFSDGSGEAYLATLATITGGQVLSEEILRNQAEAANPIEISKVIPLWPYLLAAAAILWPFDIAIRRWRMPWQSS